MMTGATSSHSHSFSVASWQDTFRDMTFALLDPPLDENKGVSTRLAIAQNNEEKTRNPKHSCDMVRTYSRAGLDKSLPLVPLAEPLLDNSVLDPVAIGSEQPRAQKRHGVKNVVFFGAFI